MLWIILKLINYVTDIDALIMIGIKTRISIQQWTGLDSDDLDGEVIDDASRNVVR